MQVMKRENISTLEGRFATDQKRTNMDFKKQKHKNSELQYWFRMRAIRHRISVEGAVVSSSLFLFIDWVIFFVAWWQLEHVMDISIEKKWDLRHLHSRWTLDYILVADKCRWSKGGSRCQEKGGGDGCELHRDNNNLGGVLKELSWRISKPMVSFPPRGGKIWKRWLGAARKKAWRKEQRTQNLEDHEFIHRQMARRKRSSLVSHVR